VLPGKKVTPADVFRVLRQRKWLIVPPFVIGTALSVLVVRRIPQQYRSETLIMVVPQRVPDSYVKATDSTRIEERLPSISEQIQSRSRLERIITDFHLYKEERARGVMEDVVQRMRANITVKLEGKAPSESFRVSYVSVDASTAQKVTERLASWYIEENLRDREHLAASTSDFLNSELEDAKRRLLDHEKKLEEYRRRYSGQLPSQLDGNLQAIQNAQLQLQTVSESINRARERRLLIERQLADAQMTRDAPPAAAAGPVGTQDAPQLTTAQQLEAAEATLERYKLRFTPDHPDVRALERTIRELRSRLDVESAAPPQQVTTKSVPPAEAARLRRVKEYQAELDVIDRQIAAGEADRVRLNPRMADYQAKVDAAPSRESELVELTRDYATLQATYASLLTKREDSKLAANLERRQIGEQFKVLDPASLPQRPVNAMTRVIVLVAGSLGGLVLGLLGAAVLEYRDSTYRTEADVTTVLSLPVLALIPLMDAEAGGQAVTTEKGASRFASAVAVALAAAAASLALGGGQL